MSRINSGSMIAEVIPAGEATSQDERAQAQQDRAARCKAAADTFIPSIIGGSKNRRFILNLGLISSLVKEVTGTKEFAEGKDGDELFQHALLSMVGKNGEDIESLLKESMETQRAILLAAVELANGSRAVTLAGGMQSIEFGKLVIGFRENAKQRSGLLLKNTSYKAS